MEFDFSQNTKVTNIETVPTDFRGLYIANPDTEVGGHVLDTGNAGVTSAVAAIQRLNGALKASRAEVKVIKGDKVDMSAFGDYGTDPTGIMESFAAKLTEAQEAAKSTGDEDFQRQIAKIKEDLAGQHSNEKLGWEKRNGALLGQLEQVMYRHAAMAAMEKAGVTDPELFLSMLQPSIKTGEVDGKFVVQVVDEQGDVRYSGTTGAEMTAPERINEMKGIERYMPFFSSEAPTGSGSKPGAAARVAVTGKTELTSTQKIAAGLKAGQHTSGRGVIR